MRQWRLLRHLFLDLGDLLEQVVPSKDALALVLVLGREHLVGSVALRASEVLEARGDVHLEVGPALVVQDLHHSLVTLTILEVLAVLGDAVVKCIRVDTKIMRTEGLGNDQYIVVMSMYV
jgi:hypothetical protein